MRLQRAISWTALVVVVVAVTVVAFLPASWLGGVVETQSGGRLSLGEPQGTLWRGSAYLGGAPGAKGAVTALLPGRFSWRLSPKLLIGIVDLRLDNEAVMSEPVTVRGSWSQWQLSPAALALPADGLAGLGAPLNTLVPRGNMELAWTALDLKREGGGLAVTGRGKLTMLNMGSRLSPVNPLGSYALEMNWQGQLAALSLRTTNGPLQLSGTGTLDHGRFQFSGQAEAADGYEASLGNLLNLLGQRRTVGGKNIIALEFK